MTTFGIYFSGMDSSQKMILTNIAVNDYLQNNPYDDVVGFTSNRGPCSIKPRYAILEEQEAFYWGQPIVALDFSSAYKLTKTAVKKKYWYMWDLEWVFAQRELSKNLPVYMGEISLIVRSPEHADLLKKVWREPIDIVEDFDVSRIISTIA
jgi:hypothetical protein